MCFARCRLACQQLHTVLQSDARARVCVCVCVCVSVGEVPEETKFLVLTVL